MLREQNIKISNYYSCKENVQNFVVMMMNCRKEKKVKRAKKIESWTSEKAAEKSLWRRQCGQSWTVTKNLCCRHSKFVAVDAVSAVGTLAKGIIFSYRKQCICLN